jgi:hypothetical protein
LKTRKLLILRIARNAKTAKNVFYGYAAATRKRYRGLSCRPESSVRETLFQIRRPINRPTGAPFSKRIRLGTPFVDIDFLKRSKFHFSHGFRWFLNFTVRIDQRLFDHWSPSPGDVKDCGTTRPRNRPSDGKFLDSEGQGCENPAFEAKNKCPVTRPGL